jgi:hypothetical protein
MDELLLEKYFDQVQKQTTSLPNYLNKVITLINQDPKYGQDIKNRLLINLEDFLETIAYFEAKLAKSKK